MGRARQVAVIGSSRCAPRSELPALAEAGVTIVCGAGDGVMDGPPEPEPEKPADAGPGGPPAPLNRSAADVAKGCGGTPPEPPRGERRGIEDRVAGFRSRDARRIGQIIDRDDGEPRPVGALQRPATSARPSATARHRGRPPSGRSSKPRSRSDAVAAPTARAQPLGLVQRQVAGVDRLQQGRRQPPLRGLGERELLGRHPGLAQALGQVQALPGIRPQAKPKRSCASTMKRSIAAKSTGCARVPCQVSSRSRTTVSPWRWPTAKAVRSLTLPRSRPAA